MNIGTVTVCCVTTWMFRNHVSLLHGVDMADMADMAHMAYMADMADMAHPLNHHFLYYLTGGV
jgi:hypothetical protein